LTQGRVIRFDAELWRSHREMSIRSKLKSMS